MKGHKEVTVMRQANLDDDRKRRLFRARKEPPPKADLHQMFMRIKSCEEEVKVREPKELRGFTNLIRELN